MVIDLGKCLWYYLKSASSITLVKTSWATWLSPTRDYERVKKLNKMAVRFQYLGRCSNRHRHLITVEKLEKIPSLQTDSVKRIVGGRWRDFCFAQTLVWRNLGTPARNRLRRFPYPRPSQLPSALGPVLQKPPPIPPHPPRPDYNLYSCPTYPARPFCIAILGLNEITGLTVSHAALLRTEFLIFFLWFGGGSDCGNSNISPNTEIPPKWHTTICQFT